jgi:coenzyme F420-reducing hydrogenase delta subunit
MSENDNFEPEIMAFACKHCAYAAADLAGAMRLQYPANVRVIQIPCSGKLDVGQTLHAFEQGADGVLVAG